MLVYCVFIEFHAFEKWDFGLMLNFSIVRGSLGGAFDGLSEKSPGAEDVQEILTTVGLATSLAQKSSSTFMCWSSSACVKDQVPCLLESIYSKCKRLVTFILGHTTVEDDPYGAATYSVSCGSGGTLGTLRRRVRSHMRKCSLRVWFCGKSNHLYLLCHVPSQGVSLGFHHWT